MRPPRFPSALALALAAHAGIALAALLVPRPTAPPPRAADEMSVEFVPDVPVVPEPQAPREPPSPPSVAVAPHLRAARTASPDAPPAAPEDSPVSVPLPAAPVSSARTTPIDLGIGTLWREVAMSGPPPSSPADAPPLPAPRSVTRILRDDLDAHDRAIGLGSEGPIVSAVHEAASPDIAPDVGSAVFEIECDAAGRPLGVHLVSADADRGRWSAVERELARLLASKKMRVPPGARGVRTRVKIAAERLLPSGEKLEKHAGAVPDDVPGTEAHCVDMGDGTRKCLDGMPVGVTGTIGDLSNIGARRSRVVHVQVLGETTL